MFAVTPPRLRVDNCLIKEMMMMMLLPVRLQVGETVHGVQEKSKTKCYCYIFYKTWTIPITAGIQYPE